MQVATPAERGCKYRTTFYFRKIFNKKIPAFGGIELWRGGNRNDGVEGDNRMCYATSKSPLGPWKYRGTYMDPTDSYTNHGSVVEYKGQWYSFYHTSSLSNHDWLRSICVDKLYFNPDGTIQTVVQTWNKK